MKKISTHPLGGVVSCGIPFATKIKSIALFAITFVLLSVNNLNAQAPANDECGSATAIPVTVGSCVNTLGTNVDATDSGIAHTCANYQGGDVWFSFVAPPSGEVAIETSSAGGFTDGGMALYSDCAGTLVECDDDDGPGLFSRIEATLTPGDTYFVAVWEWGNNFFGEFNICVEGSAAPLAGCDLALPIECDTPVAGNTVGAPNETLGSCGTSDGSGGGLWYSFTAPLDGDYKVTTCSAATDFDTKVRVYTGACDALVCVDGNDDESADPLCTHSSRHSMVEATLTAGEEYFIIVHGFGGNEGNFELLVVCPIEGCTDTTACNYDSTATVDDGSCELGEWYIPTVIAANVPMIRSCGPVAGYTYAHQACAQARFVFDPYCAEVEWDFFCQGDYDLCVSNDECPGALPVACDAPVTGSTVGAPTVTTPSCGGTSVFGSAGGLWYSYTAPSDGNYKVTTCSDLTDFDTQVRVYSGDCDALVCVSDNDDNGGVDPLCFHSGLHSMAFANLTAGEQYYILVFGFNNSEGNFELSVVCDDPCLSDMEAPTVTCTEASFDFDACPDQYGANTPNGTWISVPASGVINSVAGGGTFNIIVDLNNCVSDNNTAFADLEYSLHSSYSENTVFGCSNTIVNELMFRDECGNVSTDRVVVKFNISDPGSLPTIDCPASLAIDCNASTDPLNTGTATGDTDCGSVVISFADVVAPATDCPAIEIITRTWTATNACGLSTSCDQIITIQDTTPPVLVPTATPLVQHECTTYDVLSLMSYAQGTLSPADSTAYADYVLDLYLATLSPISNTDDCGTASIVFDHLDIEYPENPLFGGGTITEADCPVRARFILHYYSTDGCNDTPMETVTIEVKDTTAPIITSFPADVEVQCSELSSVDEAGVLAYIPIDSFFDLFEFEDDCVPYADIPLDILEGLGLISVEVTSDFTVDCPVVGTCSKTLTVSDGCYEVSHTYTITIIDTEAPVFEAFEDTVTVQCLEDVPPILDLTAEDCGDIITATSFESNTGELKSSYVLTEALGGIADWSLWMPVLADSGLVSSANFVWDANGGTFDCFADSTGHLYGTVVNDLNPSEIFVIDFWFEGNYNWTDWSAAGHLAKDPLNTCVDDHINWNFWKLVDGISNVQGAGDLLGSDLSLYHMPADYTFGFQIGLGANTKNCNFGMSGWFTYTGLLINQGTTTSVVGNGDVNVDADCENFNLVDCVNNTEFKYLYMAQDNCLNTARTCQVIIVNDTTPPTFTYVGADTTVMCDEWPMPVDSAMAVDNCIGDVTLVMVQDSIPGTCPHEFTITRTWRATDICDNFADSTQTIQVVDTEAPVMSGLPAATGTGASACINDAVINGELCPGNGLGSGDFVQTFCPDVLGDGTMMTVSFTGGGLDENWDFLNIYDGPDASGTPIAIYTGSFEGILIEHTATNPDGCITFEITSDGSWSCGADDFPSSRDYLENPIIYNVSCGDTGGAISEIEVQCDEIPEAPVVTATDNCSLPENITIAFTETSTLDSDGPCDYYITRTWSATDECANTSETFTQIIHVIDTIGPVFDPFDIQVYVECDEVMDYTVTAQDCNFEGITYTQILGSWGCSLGSYTRTYTATDSCGNSTTAVQYINIIDTTAPEILGVPADTDMECSDMPTPVGGLYFDLGGVTAEDNCQGPLTVTYAEDSMPGACIDAFVLTRSWSAIDSCGNADTLYQVINVLDTTDPEWDFFPENATYECTDVVPNEMATATDNCDLDVMVTMVADTTFGDCAGYYEITRTFTAVDNCENDIVQAQTIYIVDTTGPDFVTVPADETYECTDIIPEDLATATDDCSGPAIVSFIDYDQMTPWRVTGNTGTADLSGLPTALSLASGDEGFGGSIAAFTTVKAATVSFDYALNSDDSGEFDYFGYSINGVETFVAGTEGPFVGSVEVELAAGDEFALVATTIDGIFGAAFIDVTGISFAYTALECPVINCFIREFTAADQCGNESYATQLITIEDTTPPVFDPYAPELDMPCDEVSTTITVTATDACPLPVITMFDDLDVSGGCAGTIIRTYYATDSCGNVDSIQQIIHLIDLVAPTFIDFPADTMVQCPTDLPAVPTLTGEDNCDENPIIVFVGEVSDGLSCPETITRTWTITDNCLNQTEMSQTIIIDDTMNPTFDDAYFPADANLSCGDVIPVTEPVALDNCGIASLTFNDVTAGEGCLVVVTRTWTATDACENFVTRDQVFTITDTEAPEFTSIPPSLALDCADVVPTTQATAVDACDNGVTITHADVIVGASANCYELTRTWTVADTCNNSFTSPITTVYTITDSQAPVFDQTVTDVVVQCPDVAPAYDVVTATDNCDDGVIVVMTPVLLSSDTCGNYVTEITYTAIDTCGNVTTPISYTITVEDTMPPVFSSDPEDVQVTCEDEVPDPMAGITATDNCDDDITVVMTETVIGRAPTPGSDSDCALSTGDNIPSVDWSLVLYDFPNGDQYYTTTEAYFVEFPDGSAHLYGNVVSTTTGGGWDIDVWFEDKMDWAAWSAILPARSYKDDENVVGLNYVDWSYYIMSAGATLTGTGDYVGSSLNLTHAPSNHYYGYQVGVGANNVNLEFGNGGWFEATGTIVISGGTPIVLDWANRISGDFAFDADCCLEYQIVRTYTATDCSGNSSSVSYTVDVIDAGSEIDGCTDDTACNYNAAATNEDGSCTYPGCNDSSANNYDSTAGCDDGSCTYDAIPGCTDSGACNYDASATADDGSCDFGDWYIPEPGTFAPITLSCGPLAGYFYADQDCAQFVVDNDPFCVETEWDGICQGQYNECLGIVLGCIDTAACNYDSSATDDDGSCTYPGCNDSSANNYDSTAGCDDGSCTYDGVAGCMDTTACNYDSSADTDDGSCTYPGCIDTTANNYDSTAGCDDDSCIYPPANDLCANAIEIVCGDSLEGSTTTATNNDQPISCGTTIGAPGVWYSFTGDGSEVTFDLCSDVTDYDTKISVYSGTCDALVCVDGNDDSCGLQSSTTAILADGEEYLVYVYGFGSAVGNFELVATCVAVVPGCVDTTACNYDSAATTDDGSCTYPGCTDTTADNYDSTAGCADDTLCAYSSGCMDTTACNYDSQADTDDGSCTYPTCMDVTAINFDSTGGCDDISLCIYPPTNDLCADAIEIMCGDSLEGTTIGASNDDQPAECGTTLGAPGVWYSFTGDGSEVTFDLCSDVTDYDTKISVYSGTCDALVCVDGNDDSCGLQSSTTAILADGEEYLVYVYGFGSAVGNFELVATCVAVVPGCVDTTACNYDSAATTDDGSCTYPGCTDTTADNYDSTAGCADDTLCVYSAGCMDTTACNYDSTADSDDGSCTYPGCLDTTALNYDSTAGCDDNTLCTYPLDLCNETVTPISCGDLINGSTLGSTNTPPETCGTTATASGAWYSITGTGEQATFSLCGSLYDTKLHLFSGTCDAYVCVGGNDDACGLQSELTADLEDGVDYFLYVSGFGSATGDFVLNVTCIGDIVEGCTDATACNYDALANTDDGSCIAAGCFDPAAVNFDPGAACENNTLCIYAPENDLCADALEVFCGETISGTTVGATTDGNPTDFCGTTPSSGGVWYTFVATGPETTFSTCDAANYDTKINVYSGDCGALVCEGGNDDGPGCTGFSSELTLATTNGVTYTILVNGFNGGTGDFDLTIDCGPAAPQLQLEVTALLGGPLNPETLQMNDLIRTEASFPLTDPYTELGYEHVNAEEAKTKAEVLAVDGFDAIVDWVVIELRNGDNPEERLATQAALIQKDGDIVSTDGVSPVMFDNPGGSVLVVIRHRNHLGVCNLEPTVLTGGNETITLDFTDPNLPVMGGVLAMGVEGDVRILFAGDANSDGSVNPFDKNAHWRVENGSVYDYFDSKSDFNLDGAINPFDKNSKWRLNNGRSEQVD